jgi:hypothetical protein
MTDPRDYLPSRWAELSDSVPTEPAQPWPWPIPVDPRNAPEDLRDLIGSGAGAIRWAAGVTATLAAGAAAAWTWWPL